MKKIAGVYLGEKSVAAVLVQGKQLIAKSQVTLSSEQENPQEAGNEKLQWEAAINKTLKEIGGEGLDTFVSLSDKDFIFRSFEMPLMRRAEIISSMTFEVENAIPFKLDELIWDYCYLNNFRQRKIHLAFLGIKANIYRRYKDLFSRLNVKVINFEPSVISLVRSVKSIKPIRKVTNFALLDFSSEETYITFFYKDLPVFNRYLSVIPRGFNPELLIEKLREEILISLQYFLREFKEYPLEKLIIISNQDEISLFHPFKDELSVEVVLISPEQIVADDAFSVINLKAYGIACSTALSYRFNPFIKDPEEAAIAKRELLKEIPWNIRLISSLVALGIMLNLMSHVYLGNRIYYKKLEVTNRRESIDLPVEMRDKSLDQIKQFYSRQNQRLRELKDRFSLIRPINNLLTILPELMPQGLWFEEMKFENKKGALTLQLSGYVFLADGEKERQEFDRFIKNLKENEIYHSVFPQIELVAMERDMIGKYEVFKFSIALK